VSAAPFDEDSNDTGGMSTLAIGAIAELDAYEDVLMMPLMIRVVHLKKFRLCGLMM
jgi:hypothetical protein